MLSNFLFFISMITLILTTAAENDAMSPMEELDQRINQFKPGITAIVVILVLLFLVIVMLLLYVKHCKGGINNNNNVSNVVTSRNSGVERKVIESLPMFRFSSLRGQKDGLECAVCLNRFEMSEVLRLLPKCKHAFHVECVDTWLDAHSTCPLCRYRVHPEDVLLVVDRRSSDGDRAAAVATPKRSSDLGKIANPRVSGRHSYAGGSLEIIVENPMHNSRVSLDGWNSRRKLRNSADDRKIENQGRRWSKLCRKDGELPVQQRRLEHRIVMSNEGEAEEEEEGRRRRWSDVETAEILYLKREMMINGEEEEGSGKSVIKGRSVSEITGMSRYRGNNGAGVRKELEEGVAKRWLDWISSPAVNSATSSS